MAFGGGVPNDFINPPIPPVPPGDPSWGSMDPIGNGTTNGNVGGGANAGTVAGSNPGVAGSANSLPGVKPTAAAWNAQEPIWRPTDRSFGAASKDRAASIAHKGGGWGHEDTFTPGPGGVPTQLGRLQDPKPASHVATQSIAAGANYRPGNRYVPQVFGGFKTSNNPTGAATLPRTQPAPTSSLVNNPITRGISGAVNAIGGLFNRNQPTALPSVSNPAPSGVARSTQFTGTTKINNLKNIGL